MELREILNRAEGIIINAKSFVANGRVAEVRYQLFKLHEFLTNELVPQHAEQPDEPAEQPATESDIENLQQETTRLGKDIENLASYPESRQEPESKGDAGVVSESAKQESKDGAGVVSESKKSQIKDGSGIA